jgi:hypothetical protein
MKIKSDDKLTLAGAKFSSFLVSVLWALHRGLPICNFVNHPSDARSKHGLGQVKRPAGIPSNNSRHDLFERNAFELFRTGVPGDTHGFAPVNERRSNLVVRSPAA